MAHPAASTGPVSPRRVRVVFDVEEHPRQCLLDETDLNATSEQRATAGLLHQVLTAWAHRTHRDVLLGRALPCHWDASDDRLGVAPDVALFEPPPPAGTRALRLGECGHEPPRVAVEIVSEATARRDYHDAPLRYGLLKAREVWVFDPGQCGPGATGGPFVLQVWRRQGEGAPMQRVYAGPGPVRTDELGAWLVVTDEGRRLRLSDDMHGRRLWPTESGSTSGEHLEAQSPPGAERR